ncbi:MAG: GWxTD domain-containing protein [Ignavibacteria bacterium]|nr:GWxTD domain-containing protein [Ignavibacteria bacterium]
MKPVKIAMALLVSLQLFGQVEQSTDTYNKLGLPTFYYELLNYKTEGSAATRVDVFVQVPFNSLQFIKDGTGFKAEYTVTVSVYSKEKENLLTEKLWSEKITSQDFDQTHSRSNFNLSLKSFSLTPGEYVFVISVEDKDSRKKSSYDANFKVKAFENKIDISDLLFIGNKMTVDGKEKVFPNISKIISTAEGKISVYAEVYADSATLVLLKYYVSSKEKISILEKTSEKDLHQGINRITIETDSITLPLDNYVFTLVVEDLNSSTKATFNKGFFSRLEGVPPSITNVDKAIAQLIYLATTAELDSIKEAKTSEARLEKFLNFWKSKDPNKATPENEAFNEYYRRVEYTNIHFTHYTEGWKSDMGMVYIILGAPNSVDRHPFEYDSKPYEVWEYYQINRQFIFVDNTGFGDYRLTTPFYNDLERYR